MKRNTGQHVVGAARQSTEHAGGICIVGRFPQYHGIEHHHRVGAQHNRSRVVPRHAGRLLPGKPADVRRRCFTVEQPLVDVRWRDLEVVAGAGQQVGATR